jgi:predicted SprT family Zn-dependent metalloprotease
MTFHPNAQRWVVIHEFCHVLAVEMLGLAGHGSAFRQAMSIVLNGEGRADLMVELERKLTYIPLEPWATTPIHVPVRGEIPHF